MTDAVSACVGVCCSVHLWIPQLSFLIDEDDDDNDEDNDDDYDAEDDDDG